MKEGGDMRHLIKMSIAIMMAITANISFADNNQQEANKKIVVSFYNDALNKKDFNAASQYLGPYYKQHNPTAADGAAGFKTFIEYLQKQFPESHSEIKQIFADGDYVILHVHSVRVPGTRGRAIIDVFRLKSGKIVEHWDVVQDIPEKSANDNGMFWCFYRRIARLFWQ